MSFGLLLGYCGRATLLLVVVGLGLVRKRFVEMVL